jgi:hypothetical protein
MVFCTRKFQTFIYALLNTSGDYFALYYIDFMRIFEYAEIEMTSMTCGAASYGVRQERFHEHPILACSV